MPTKSVMLWNIGKVEGLNQAKYRKYIIQLRNLRKDITKEISHEYVIPESPPSRWLDIRLIYGDSSIILRVDPRNLYVRGYSRNEDTEFWEFSDSSLIYGSKLLPYSGSLLGDGGLCSAASERFPVPPGHTPGFVLSSIPLGYPCLRQAVTYLASANPYVLPVLSAGSMLCIIQMVTEAARIELIGEYVVQNLWATKTIPPKMQFIQTALGMGTFSSLRKSNITLRSSKTKFRRVLLSIHHVRVDIDRSGPHKIHGTVSVSDDYGKLMCEVYNRSPEDPESIGPDKYLSLIGPAFPIDAGDPFVIDVSLWDHDDEIAKENFVFNARLFKYRKFLNQHLDHCVSGKHGNVFVSYSVIRSSLSATVKVVMLNYHDHDGESSSADVYGTIIASYILADSGSSTTTRTLFEKSENESVLVSPQQSMALTRPVFPVPLASDLTIVVDLWVYDNLSTNINGCVKFIPGMGTQLRIIGGCRQVQVSVTFE